MTLTIKTASPYQVVIENDILDKVGKIAAQTKKAGAKAMIVSETNVFPLYGERLKASLARAGFQIFTFVFPAGETSKQISTVCEIYQALAENGFTRSDFIVTLGGGVTGDMGGFAAATFLRGISFLQVPTTLLAQVDASVGGKTGIDLPFGKNLVGAFHQPLAVAADPKTLTSLPERYFRDGMGEVIKYACISDPDLFQNLESGIVLENLEHLIGCCVACKKNYIEEDTKDTGNRMILNFGHTFGHALEKLHQFQGLSHGEAVSVGMVLAARAGERLGVTASGTSQKLCAVLERYHLPIEDGFSKEEIIQATALDKKSMGDILNFILLEEIGKSRIYPIPRKELPKLLE